MNVELFYIQRNADQSSDRHLIAVGMSSAKFLRLFLKYCVMSPPYPRLSNVRPNSEAPEKGGIDRIVATLERYSTTEGFIMTMLKKIATMLVSLTAALLLTIGLA